MKKLLYGTLFLALVGITFVGCEKNDRNLEVTTFDDLFAKVSEQYSEQSSEDEAVYISFEYDGENENVNVLSIETKELDFLILESEATYTRKKNGDAYTIDCDNGQSSWSKTCDGKISCGKLAVECLDAGGCVEICKQEIVYVPINKTFYMNIVR